MAMGFAVVALGLAVVALGGVIVLAKQDRDTDREAAAVRHVLLEVDARLRALEGEEAPQRQSGAFAFLRERMRSWF